MKSKSPMKRIVERHEGFFVAGFVRIFWLPSPLRNEGERGRGWPGAQSVSAVTETGRPEGSSQPMPVAQRPTIASTRASPNGTRAFSPPETPKIDASFVATLQRNSTFLVLRELNLRFPSTSQPEAQLQDAEDSRESAEVSRLRLHFLSLTTSATLTARTECLACSNCP